MEKYWCFIYISGVAVFAGMPKFIGHLQNVTVPDGRDATFTCSVTNLGGHKVLKPSLTENLEVRGLKALWFW